MIRWLEVSGRHVILRPNLQGREFPLVPVEIDDDGPLVHHRPGRLVLEPLQRRLIDLGLLIVRSDSPQPPGRPAADAASARLSSSGLTGPRCDRPSQRA